MWQCLSKKRLKYQYIVSKTAAIKKTVIQLPDHQCPSTATTATREKTIQKKEESITCVPVNQQKKVVLNCSQNHVSINNEPII